jgi:hypothetical protein
MTDCKNCVHKRQCDSYNHNKEEAICIIHEPIWLEAIEGGDESICGYCGMAFENKEHNMDTCIKEANECLKLMVEDYKEYFARKKEK